ncbi:MAG TPA: zinc-binding dehydrogenase, partial [Gemmatimonadales bacterium]|nr:zinc-binding dehydrogenase [Gemmatimonadales bacterium]
FPHVLGADAAGEIEAVGEGVTGFRPGDRVMVNPGLSCGTCPTCLSGEQPLCRRYRILGEHLEGTIAEYLVVPERNLARFGEHFSWAEAAAFPLATLTAWRMLTTRARIRPGETVLVWGMGGGVSQAAVQIAKLAGARVIATSSSDAKLQVAKSLGADVTLNHGLRDVARDVRDLTGVGADVVVDSVGEKTWDASLRALRPMGRLVTCGATTGPHVALDIRKLFWFQWSLLGSTMGNQREFAEITALAGRGLLRPVVDSVVPLRDGAAAFRRMADGHQLGKLVIEVTP